MPLTYQPFAEVPEITALGNELRHNVNDRERYGSMAAGAGILMGAFLGHGVGRLLMLAAAGALLHRGFTGHCMLYEKLGMSTRSPEPLPSQEEQVPGGASKPQSMPVAA
jgi:hypothetical protein